MRADYTPFNPNSVWEKDGYEIYRPVTTDQATLPNYVPQNRTEMGRFYMMYKTRDPEYFEDNVTDQITLGDTAFNNTPWALKIPQGTGQGERIGSAVKVLKDKFTIKVAIPYTNEFGSTMTKYLSQRYFHVRAVAIYVPRVRLMGNPAQDFQPVKMFTDPTRITSGFKRQGAFGYRKLYDKTFKFLPVNGVAADETQNPNGTLRRTSSPSHLTIQFNVGSYIRRYSDHDSLGAPVAARALDSEGNPLEEDQDGLRTGEIIWYINVTDPNPPVHLTDTPQAGDPYKRMYPSHGYVVYCKRDTVYCDA